MTELYLYQTLHLHKGRPRLVAEHIRALHEASQKLFKRPYNPDPKQLEARIAALAAVENYPDTVSGFVRIELLPDGTQRLLPAGVSLYDGYALRSVTPDAVVFEYALAQPDAPTSAHEAAVMLARCMAENAGASAAVRCDHQGVLHAIDGAPLFALRGKEIFCAPEDPLFPSVERELGIRSIQGAGLQLTDQPALREELPHYDEVFSVDHRGVTALAHGNGNPYMSLAAERVAAAMERLFKGGR